MHPLVVKAFVYMESPTGFSQCSTLKLPALTDVNLAQVIPARSFCLSSIIHASAGGEGVHIHGESNWLQPVLHAKAASFDRC